MTTVEVLATVVVHVHVTRVFGDGRRTWFGVVLATVVVHVVDELGDPKGYLVLTVL